MLPENHQGEVRKGHASARQGYKNANPFLPRQSIQHRVRNVLEFGLDIDQIYDLLGDPAHIETYREGTLQRLTYVDEATDTVLVYLNKGKVTGWQALNPRAEETTSASY